MTKIISLDLDGVLNTYDGKYDENEIPPIREGAIEFLTALSKNYMIEIFTVRDKDLTINWLTKNGLIKFISNVTDKKNPRTTIFIDDRALSFNGDYVDTLKRIELFSPHWKQN